MVLECCVNGVESAINAEKGGADRVELCDNLYEGGTTPSIACIKLCREKIQIGLNVIIRPRGGDFCYSNLEYEIVKQDIQACKEAGVDAVVFGILKEDGSIDIERNKALVELAKPMQATFHRAIDMSIDPVQAIEQLIECGFDTVLTSGGENKALDGKSKIAAMVQKANGRIEIMAGSGVDESNIEELVKFTKAKAFHVSCRKVVESKMQFRPEGIFMGGLKEIPEFSNKVTDTNRILKVRAILNRLS